MGADDEREAADQLGDEAVLDKVRRFRLQEAVRLSTTAGNAQWVGLFSGVSFKTSTMQPLRRFIIASRGETRRKYTRIITFGHTKQPGLVEKGIGDGWAGIAGLGGTWYRARRAEHTKYVGNCRAAHSPVHARGGNSKTRKIGGVAPRPPTVFVVETATSPSGYTVSHSS